MVHSGAPGGLSVQLPILYCKSTLLTENRIKIKKILTVRDPTPGLK